MQLDERQRACAHHRMPRSIAVGTAGHKLLRLAASPVHRAARSRAQGLRAALKRCCFTPADRTALQDRIGHGV